MEIASVPFLLLIGYLPGALVFRLPIAGRDRRAALPADERVFWHVMLSVAWSLTIGLLLASLESYGFDRLLLLNGVLCLLLAVSGGARLIYRGQAARMNWTGLVPIALIVLGVWRFFPPSEYIIGGKDPGTYMTEGIQIAQRGTLTIHDPIVGSVPDYARDLFFPSYHRDDYYSLRFMGFYLRDAQGTDINGQFPQLFPVSLAIGYGLDGLTGARLTTGVWGILGLLAVYFAGARIVGRTAALAGVLLLGLNVTEVWFARYPNSELVMQALLFAALLAFARAHQDDDRFFAPVAGVLVGLILFTRVEALPVVAGMLAAGLLVWLVERRALRGGFLAALIPWSVAAGFYYAGPILPYTKRFSLFLHNLPAMGVAAAGVTLAAMFAVLVLMRRHFAERARRLVPMVTILVIVAAALYAAFLRQPGGRLAAHDAYALRNFTNLYLLWPGLAAALIGFAVVVRRDFWRDPAFVLVFSGLSLFFFYKIQIVPIEFWASRRFLPVILPGALLFAAAAGLGPGARRQWPRRAAGIALVVVLGYQYTARAAPVMPHVEYAGMIPALERLAARFDDHDLVLVEARDAGADTHVLALPLAYIYARNVLVLNAARPDKIQLRAFLEDAQKKYRHVYFVGGGGTDLLSRHISARAVADEKIKVPEFESTHDQLPALIRRKDFDYSVYELTLDAPAERPFSLDVGNRDDLNVLRFLAKESSDGRTFRWTGPQSFVAIPGMNGTEREVVLVMHDGGRPAQAPPPHVDVRLNGVPLGGADVGHGFREYRFAIPPNVAAQAAGVDDPAQLTLVSSVWIPQQLLGGPDDRRLGVMLDRVDVR